MDNTEDNSHKTLMNNNISLFIIRIDFIDAEKPDFADIINKLTNTFSRIEKTIHTNINVDIESQQFEKQESYIYTLRRDNGSQIKFLTHENALVFETNNYIDKTSYIEVISNIIIVLKTFENYKSKRFGMRFVNNFPCNKVNDISKIFEKDIAKNIINIAKKENIMRIINIEEFNFDNYKSRIQYGLINKFYPSIITNYDLLLDIDIYYDGVIEIQDWDDTLKLFNHMAYDYFVKYVNPKYIETIK